MSHERSYGGLSLRVPDQWQDVTTVKLHAPTEAGRVPRNVTISREPLEGRSLDEVLGHVRKTLIQWRPQGLKLEPPKKTELKGYPCLQFDIRHAAGDDANSVMLVRKQVIVTVGKSMFSIVYTDEESAFASGEGVWRDILDSLEFPDGEGPR